MIKPALGLLTACVAGLVVLALRPAFDLDVAALFYEPPSHFVGETRLGTIARYTAWIAPLALALGLCLAWIAASWRLLPRRFAPSGRHLLVMMLSLALGPGLLVYGTFKPLAHRPRPTKVTQFGGRDAFRPFTRFDGGCTHSCSFPSGETAGSTWTIVPASLVPPPWRGPAIAGAVLFAVATGGLRMAFGGHFLSDVLAAAALTLAASLAVWVALMRGARR